MFSLLRVILVNVMKIKIPLLTLQWFLAIALWTVVGAVQAQTLDYQQYNAIIFNDLKTTSEIEGRTFVGHDFTGTSSVTLGGHLGNMGAIPSDDRTFVAGNNIFAGSPINLEYGSLYLDGTKNSRPINFNGGGTTVADHTIDASTASILGYSIAQSQALMNLLPDSNATYPTVTDGPTKFFATMGGDGLAVFNVNATSIFDNPKAQQLELYSDDPLGNIVINVSGTTVNWTKGNMVGLFNDDYWQAHTIWNFYEATTIDFGSHNFNGAILAPYASITTTSNIDGLVVANNLTTSAAVRLPDDCNVYDGFLATVPEPGGALFILALGGLMLVARNRRLFV